MASIIRIKRSSGTEKPASLAWGELGYVTGIGSYGGLNQYKDRIFVGDDGTNSIPVGGHYYTSMMEHAPGTVDGVQNTRNTDGGIVAVMDNTRRVDQWNVDNLRLDLNTLSSTDTDGDVIFSTDGSGHVNIVDDTFLSFGTDHDAMIEYDEDGDNEVKVTGANWQFDNYVRLGCVGISSNVIETKAGCGDLLFIDPYPDGLSNEGTVVIKGSLQVDGTTTSVNSTISTLNDPILHLGDLTSEKTVMADVAVGVNTITLDSVIGINTGDVVSGPAGLPVGAGAEITQYNETTKIITIQGNTTAGISTTTQITVSHAYDTQTDRGISFGYNTSSGTSNNKTGFFGYIDQTSPNSSAPIRSWTYIPDSNLANSIATGTRGNLDIKGIYYQTGDYNTHGVVYFDENGLQTSTNAASAPALTSKQVLTAITKNTLDINSSVTLDTGDIVRQDNSNAYGVVESGGNLNSISVVGVEGVFDTTNNLRKEGNNGTIENLSVTPTSVSVIYSNKPTWTSTLDGGTF
tara:strand:+ start:10170 stop:11720 length:1551 start_codon:yes stop_codon:yes gene_type:complete